MFTQKRNIWLSIAAAVLLLGGLSIYSVFGTFSGSDERFLYIDRDDTTDSVYHKLSDEGHFLSKTGFKLLAAVGNYAAHLHPGRYDVGSGHSTLTVFRQLRNGTETPVRLTIPVLRTSQDLARFLSKHLEPSTDAFAEILSDTLALAQYGQTPETAVCLFIPNTYEVYWSLTPEELLSRMQKEAQHYWNNERLQKAKEAGLTPNEVITVASIVEQETAYNPEKPMVAGMYLNRVRKNMPLQADPTVKFALGNFALRRILHEHLKVDSPYNTYKNAGLPPGPICIPSMASIEAVLNFARHDYLYMCAKEDFSGSHNFAVTYADHLKNAAKYTSALNQRGIR